MAKKRADMTPEELERIRTQQRESYRRRVANMTPEEIEIRRARQREANRRFWEKRLAGERRDRAIAREIRERAFTPPVNNETLSRYYIAAKSKNPHAPVPPPDWCSPARWRIFLRWRANQSYYEFCGDFVK